VSSRGLAVDGLAFRGGDSPPAASATETTQCHAGPLEPADLKAIRLVVDLTRAACRAEDAITDLRRRIRAVQFAPVAEASLLSLLAGGVGHGPFEAVVAAAVRSGADVETFAHELAIEAALQRPLPGPGQ